MQPLRLVIPGAYWDSQIYEGRLYLFGRSGDIRAIDWDSLIKTWNIPKTVMLAMICAFQRSDYLYGVAASGLMRDSEIRAVMTGKFARLAEIDLEVSQRRMEMHTVSQQDNPLPFPHADSEIYSRRLYISSKSGLFGATCNKRTKYPVSTRPEKIWDAPILGISASYGALALAAGSEGLYEHRVIQYRWEGFTNRRDPARISQKHCVDCSWVFYSVFGSSSLGTGFLAAYRRDQNEEEERFRRRLFDRVIDDTELFGLIESNSLPKYSWGSQDKLCQAINGTIKVVRYMPWLDEPERRLEPLGSLRLNTRSSVVVSAAVALFGTIVELDSGIAIIPSAGRSIFLHGEPVNWRVFPRSRHYENQLHVIYDDRLEIFSFNQDYLVDQGKKVSGIRYYSGRSSEAIKAL